MKKISVVGLCALASLLFYAGCTSEISEEDQVGVAKQNLTIEQCQAQLDQCLDVSGLFGLVTCNMEFTFCAATSAIPLPEPVTDAIEDAAACRAALGECLEAAETPLQAAVCAEDQARCVAGILDLQLPEVVTGTRACVEDGMACINSAESLSDLTACGETMMTCAIDEASAVLPEPVGDAISDVADCNFALGDCVRAATSPADLAACGRTQAECIADGLGVELPVPELPELPGLPGLPQPEEIIGCAETAADCAMAAESIADLNECTAGFVECTTEAVNIPAIPNPVDCQVAWVRCLIENPIEFISCSEELRSCLRPGSETEPEQPADE